MNPVLLYKTKGGKVEWFGKERIVVKNLSHLPLCWLQENVIDLLRRVCTVSVRTLEIVGKLRVNGFED